MLHLTNGDSAAQSMREAGLPGEVLAWPDSLYEGPTPAEHWHVWRETRARYLSDAGYCSFENAIRDFARVDAVLERYPEHDELVLWFEHDLFDQLLLARHLHWLGTSAPGRTRLSLICIDGFPGVEPFHGLGQLTPAQLASLFPSRRTITRAELSAGADVWRALTSDDPRPLNVVAARGIRELPFMQGALRRYLEEFPGSRDGLSRTERFVLNALREQPRSARDLFLALQGQEERVFMGDLSFWRILRDMAAGAAPLIEWRKGDSHRFQEVQEKTVTVPISPISLALAGHRVLDGEDAIAIRGIDRWMGGVHLTPDRVWRWDGNQPVLTRVPQR